MVFLIAYLILFRHALYFLSKFIMQLVIVPRANESTIDKSEPYLVDGFPVLVFLALLLMLFLHLLELVLSSRLILPNSSRQLDITPHGQVLQPKDRVIPCIILKLVLEFMMSQLVFVWFLSRMWSIMPFVLPNQLVFPKVTINVGEVCVVLLVTK